MPTAISPLRLRRRSGSTASSSHPNLSAENIGSRGRPVIDRTSPATPLGGQPCGDILGAAVLPAEHRPERLARRPFPHDRRLTLGADAEGDNGAVAGIVEAIHDLGDGGEHGRLELLGVLLDPAWLRITSTSTGTDGTAQDRAARCQRARLSSSSCPGRRPTTSAGARQPRPSTSRTAAAIPLTVRPKYSSRNAVSPVGANSPSIPRLMHRTAGVGTEPAHDPGDRGAEAAGRRPLPRR